MTKKANCPLLHPQPEAPNTPGFAIEIRPDTDLGIAMLIAEDEDGQYEPVGPVSSVNEAYEIAKSDMVRADSAPALSGIVLYRVWAAGLGGTYRTAWVRMPYRVRLPESERYRWYSMATAIASGPCTRWRRLEGFRVGGKR